MRASPAVELTCPGKPGQAAPEEESPSRGQNPYEAIRSTEKLDPSPFSECGKRALGPALPIDRALHRSLVVHEVAHHIAAANFKVAKPTVVAHEYIASITMFATMAPEQRTRILEHVPGYGFDAEQKINLMIRMLDPLYFGAEAYRHFMKPGNGQSFLERVLSGRALAVEEPLM
jgi:hypothetical protein